MFGVSVSPELAAEIAAEPLTLGATRDHAALGCPVRSVERQ